MEDDTTTGAASASTGASKSQTINGIAVDDQGQALAVPEETETGAAAEEPTNGEPSEQATVTEESGADTALPETDDKLAKFATSHGLELDSPNAIKAAKMAMDNQAEFQRTRQKASEMEKSMLQMSDESAEVQANATGENPELLKRVQRQEVKASIRDFWDANPDARQYESQMSEIASTAGLYGTPEAILKASYAMARADDSANLKSQGGREALQSLASKQQAAVPRGSAVTGSPNTEAAITSQNVDRLVGSHDLQWFEKNREAINRAMAG